MKIDGKAIAQQILNNLKERVDNLKYKSVQPHMFIITFGNNPQTESYLKQKLLKAEYIGAKITIQKFEETIDQKTVYDLIEKLNNDPLVHGIIVQRPMPNQFDEQTISEAVIPQKDVDGFNTKSPFSVPVALAVFKLLENALGKDLILENKNIVIVGRGITAGQPIRDFFAKKNIRTINVDSKTENENEIFNKADIIISAVGKDILHQGIIKPGVILIGVGMHTEDGKIKGDYNEAEIEKIASFYTPTPGGVGPVNVALLLQNLVEASENQSY